MAEKIEQIDHYRVLNLISEGTSGQVFLVTRDESKFALKLLKESVGASGVVRFRRESATLARLNQENLVKIFNLGEYKGTPYLVMEYLQGDSLEAKLKKEGVLSEEVALHVIRSVAKGLHELHKYNLVHRDIKTANILFTEQKIPKLIDLGLVDDIEQLKSETALVGTPLYCSPEQSRVLKRDVDFRSDLYSLGVVLYEILCGTPPFTGSLSEILQKHASIVPADVRNSNPKVTAATALIIKKLLSKDPDDRYQTVSGLIRDIDRIAEIDQLIAKNVDPELGSNDNLIVSSSAAFVARDEETKLLKSSWATVTSGKPGIAIVTGASGSGKTRLVSEFLRAEVGTDDKTDFLILRGKCQIFDRDMPFGAMREAIDAWVEDIYLSQPEVKEKAIARIIEAGKGSENRLVQFSKALQRVFTSTTSTQQIELNAEGEREVFLKDMSSFFVKLSKQWKGIIFFVDDLQWLDDSSLQLIETIFNIEMKSVFLLLGTSRDDQESQERLGRIKERLLNHINAEIKVLPFSREQLGKLVKDFLGQHKVESSIVDRLHLQANGSPFVAIEYLRASIEQGLIRFKEGEWVISQGGFESLALSENVFSLIIKRSDKLQAKAKTLLQYAALWGGQFVAIDIAAIANVNSEDIPATMRSCEECGLVERQGAHKWRFVHDKIQESLVGSIDQKLLSKMSDELAEYYEKKESKSTEEVFSLARIRTKGDLQKNFKKAIEANIRGGNLAIENFAFSEACVIFKTAYEISNTYDSEKTFEREIAPKLATCATITGQWVLAKECADLNIKLARNKMERQFSLMMKVWSLKNRGDYTAGFKYFEEACKENGEPYPPYFLMKVLGTLVLWFWTTILDLLLPLAPKYNPKIRANSEWLARRADLYIDAHWCAEFLGWRTDYIFVAFKLLHIGLTTRRPRELALGYSWIGHVYGSWGAGMLAKIYFEKADAILKGVDDKFTVALCKQKELDGLNNAGLIPIFENGHKRILEPYEKYLTPTQFGFASVWRMFQFSFRGLNKEALSVFEEGITGIKTGKTVLGDVWINAWLAQSWLQLVALGRQKDAERAKLDTMRTNNKNRYNGNAARITLGTELQVHRVLEDLDGSLEESIAAFMGGNNLYLFNQHSCHIFTQGLFNVLNVLEGCKDPGKRLSLRSEFNRIVRILNLKSFQPLIRANIFLLRGRYYRLIGLPLIARHYFKKSEKLASQADGQRTLFELQRELARIYKSTGVVNLAINKVNSALALAVDHEWAPTLGRLQNEFGILVENHLSYKLQRGTEEFVGDKTIARSTSMASQGGRFNPTMTTQGNKTMFNAKTMVQGNQIDDIRFVDVLLEVTRSLVDSIDPRVQSSSVLKQIVKLFGAERGVIFIKDEKTNELSIVAGKSASGEELTKLTGYSGTVVKKAFETGEPLIVTGTEEGEALGSESAVLHGLRSIMATPLKIKEDVIGVVYVDSSLTKGLFTSADIEMFSTLSKHVSVGFELARMAKIELEKANLKRELDVQAAIAAESNKVKVLVDNMQQALFSIDQDGTIVEPVSKFSKNVFGFEVAGTNVMETLYPADSVKEEERAKLKSMMTTVFGEDDLQWSLMESDIPKKIARHMAEPASDKTFKIAPAPIWSDQEKLEKILFVVEDITDLEILEQKIREHRYETTILEEILGKDPVDLGGFLEESLKTTENLMLKTKEKQNPESTKSFLRDLHTLKGNARLFGLKTLSSQVHEVESQLIADPTKLDGNFSSELQKIERTLGDFSTTFAKVFRQKPEETQATTFNTLAVSSLSESLMKILPKLPRNYAELIQQNLNRLSYKSVCGMALKFKDMVSDISGQLNKQVDFTVKGDALLETRRLQTLQECLLHLIRNSIDHGLEDAEERVKAKKESVGKISVNIEERENKIWVSVSDDGKGIDGDKVWAQALKKGIVPKDGKEPDQDEKRMVIFAPGFSSKDKVSDISGRGIGLDVVQKNVSDMGGEVKINSTIGQSTSFLITLPLNENSNVLPALSKAR